MSMEVAAVEWDTDGVILTIEDSAGTKGKASLSAQAEAYLLKLLVAREKARGE